MLSNNSNGTMTRRLAVRDGVGQLVQRTSENVLWVSFVGSFAARSVAIGTTSGLVGRLRGLQVGSPVPLHLMWQMRGGMALERALHRRFATYRKYGEWFGFGEDHPVALVATVAVGLGDREFPRDDLAGRGVPLSVSSILVGSVRGVRDGFGNALRGGVFPADRVAGGQPGGRQGRRAVPVRGRDGAWRVGRWRRQAARSMSWGVRGS
ncbi:GIY-YIG nuclease family protein [Streptomyces iconiensis]|uniref:GIY-YIG nuclease family protein n=1 Tax=Streptomyces iconiensis TaxID=1384038 RepID=UPI003D2F92F7